MKNTTNAVLILMPEDAFREEVVRQISEVFPQADFTVIGDLQEAKTYAKQMKPLTHSMAVVSGFEEPDASHRYHFRSEGVGVAAELTQIDDTLPILGISSTDAASLAFCKQKPYAPLVTHVPHIHGQTRTRGIHYGKWMLHNARLSHQSEASALRASAKLMPIGKLLALNI